MNEREINLRLLQLHGREIDTNLPKFRVVFSEGLTEKRTGEFWTSRSGVALPSPVIDTREVEKYNYLYKEAWILERLVPNTLRHEISGEADGTYSYEPLYVFDEVPLSWWHVEQVISQLLNRPKRKQLTQKDVDEAEAEKLRLAKIKTKDMLANLTALDSALGDGDAVSFANLDARPSKQGETK